MSPPPRTFLCWIPRLCLPPRLLACEDVLTCPWRRGSTAAVPGSRTRKMSLRTGKNRCTFSSTSLPQRSVRQGHAPHAARNDAERAAAAGGGGGGGVVRAKDTVARACPCAVLPGCPGVVVARTVARGARPATFCTRSEPRRVRLVRARPNTKSSAFCCRDREELARCASSRCLCRTRASAGGCGISTRPSRRFDTVASAAANSERKDSPVPRVSSFSAMPLRER